MPRLVHEASQDRPLPLATRRPQRSLKGLNTEVFVHRMLRRLPNRIFDRGLDARRRVPVAPVGFCKRGTAQIFRKQLLVQLAKQTRLHVRKVPARCSTQMPFAACYYCAAVWLKSAPGEQAVLRLQQYNCGGYQESRASFYIYQVQHLCYIYQGQFRVQDESDAAMAWSACQAKYLRSISAARSKTAKGPCWPAKLEAALVYSAFLVGCVGYDCTSPLRLLRLRSADFTQ